MKVTLEEAVEHLEDGFGVVLECDGYYYEISQSENWVGGDVYEGYISLVMGNVVYDSAKYILEQSINHLSKNGEEVTIILG